MSAGYNGTGAFQMDNNCGCGAGSTDWLFFSVYLYVGQGGIASLQDAVDQAAVILAAADFDAPPSAWLDWPDYDYGTCAMNDPGAHNVPVKKWQHYGLDGGTGLYGWGNGFETGCPSWFGAGGVNDSPVLGPCCGFVCDSSSSVMASKGRLGSIGTACVSVRTGTAFGTLPDPGLAVVSCGERTEAGGIVLDNVTSCVAADGAWQMENAWVGGYVEGDSPVCADCVCP